jgi:hypothetical protein
LTKFKALTRWCPAPETLRSSLSPNWPTLIAGRAYDFAALRPTGTTMRLPLYLSSLAGAYVELAEFDDACTRQLHPAAFSVLHIPAAFSIDAKGPTMAR